ncbi:MAG TPA: pseudouridine synthase [Actinomycetota bacterium]|nr:pseudouridine synthase [Actinomycetota bacterium]
MRSQPRGETGSGQPGPRAGRPRGGRAVPVPRAPEGPQRLQKVLAAAGLGSRRQAEELIRAGRVTVDGRAATLGERVDPRSSLVAVDGVPVPVHPELRYYAFNKPRGVTTTLRDPHARVTLAGFLPPGPRVFPVGRLDRESEGLLLLTNDGALAHRVQHPRYGVEKEYLVEVEGEVGRPTLAKLLQGVPLEDGEARATAAAVVQRLPGRTSLRVVMREGRKREVRRMLEALGFPVRRLVRVRVGPVRLGRLRPGELRPLEAKEVAALYRLTALPRAKPDHRLSSPEPRGGG